MAVTAALFRNERRDAMLYNKSAVAGGIFVSDIVIV
jgi:hypothetical protein